MLALRSCIDGKTFASMTMALSEIPIIGSAGLLDDELAQERKLGAAFLGWTLADGLLLLCLCGGYLTLQRGGSDGGTGATSVLLRIRRSHSPSSATADMLCAYLALLRTDHSAAASSR